LFLSFKNYLTNSKYNKHNKKNGKRYPEFTTSKNKFIHLRNYVCMYIIIFKTFKISFVHVGIRRFKPT